MFHVERSLDRRPNFSQRGHFGLPWKDSKGRRSEESVGKCSTWNITAELGLRVLTSDLHSEALVRARDLATSESFHADI